MSEHRPPCAGLWNTPMVHLNGDLTTCCLDTKLKNRLGNLRENTLQELWHGDTLHRWRVAQILGDFEGSGPYCSSCNWRSAGTYPDHNLEAYLIKAGDAEVLETFRAMTRARQDGTNEASGNPFPEMTQAIREETSDAPKETFPATTQSQRAGTSDPSGKMFEV